ncbi:MAG: alpha/beta hydrolase [Solirubrobacterales bacterium]|nr:alpha/beta hydrolase [Solirubrobacterales bacterium]
MPTFTHEGHRLAYTGYGEGTGGNRVVVLIHGLLLSQRMQAPLAEALAERGNRVITLDVLGHGKSDRPRDMGRYSMTFFGEQVIGLLDHLGIDQAVVGGTSLGANVALEACAVAPERVRGMIVEMPVLDHALLGCALAFTPMMAALTIGEPIMRAVSWLTRQIPDRGPELLQIGLDTMRQDPAPSAAVLQGLFFGRVAPHRSIRRTFTAPALVIGHRRDPVHPLSDSGMLVEELPNGRLLEASSILELRVAPERLTNEIARFVDECWKPQGRRAKKAA